MTDRTDYNFCEFTGGRVQLNKLYLFKCTKSPEGILWKSPTGFKNLCNGK